MPYSIIIQSKVYYAAITTNLIEDIHIFFSYHNKLNQQVIIIMTNLGYFQMNDEIESMNRNIR